MSSWHKSSIADVALAFGTDVTNGKINVKPGRKRRGDNNIFLLPLLDSKSVLKKMTSDASLAILTVVYILTALMGRYVESLFGVSFVVLVFCVSFSVKNASSKRIVNSYRLLLPYSSVIENGDRIRLSVFDVEVGDLIEFSQGDIIPADARIVSAVNLTVAERYVDSLTGKISYRRETKNPESLIYADDGMDTYANVLYAASIVVSGKGSAIVTETGADTKFSGNKSGMRIVSDDDIPDYFSNFYKNTRRLSLLAFLAVIPLTLLALILKTGIAQDNTEFDLLYTFQLLLAVSVTCMSELVVAPAESLVTKELLISSRKRKVSNNLESRITKLHSAETIADTDTVLILHPEVLVDSKHCVRRIHFADKRYRFDALKSEDLNAFMDAIYPILLHSGAQYLSKDLKAVKQFFSDCGFSMDFRSDSQRPRFLRNFPVAGARACVFNSDEQQKPKNYIFYTTDINIIQMCSQFRTEGGGLWKLDRGVIENIYSEHKAYQNTGLSTVCFVSSDTINKNDLIFEGMIGLGREYPFADGELAEEFFVSGIHTILFLDKETPENINFAYNCGFIDKEDDIVLASSYIRNGLDITDAPIGTKAYIGFDRSETEKLSKRLQSNGRKVLPIIKDSIDRKGIAHLSVFATHCTQSHDSIRISSSLALQPADANSGGGGIFDTLKMIRGASMARLKLGVYKNYLAFSMFLRAVALICALLIGKSGANLTSIMILSTGFICDAIAVVSIMKSKGIPVNPKEAALDAKVMYSSTLYWCFSVAGAISGVAVFAITEALITVGKIQTTSSVFLIYSVLLAQIISLGAFLVILNKRSRRRSLNLTYLLFSISFIVFLFVQEFLPQKFYTLVDCLSFYPLQLDLIPFIILISFIPLVLILLISKLLLMLSEPRKNNSR